MKELKELNRSGSKPFGYKLIVKVKKEPKEVKTKSGIITEQEDGFGNEQKKWINRQMKVNLGKIVAVGSLAFQDRGDDTPNLGDSIIIKRYSGVHVEGKYDDEAYRVIEDTEVVCIRENDEDVETI